jgi:type I restriction enzyme, S subunit
LDLKSKQVQEFKEIAELIQDNLLPSKKNPVPYIGLEHIEQGTLRLSSIGKSSEVISQKLKFKKNDILFGKLRPYFRKVIRPNFDGICSTDIFVVRAKEGISQIFLYYVMASNEFVNYSSQGSQGTKMPRASWDFLEKYEQMIPSLDEQEKIGKTLDDLDAKIQNIQNQNRILEQTAQAIFQSWFVDFDGVTEWDDSELGKIPKGWSVKFLSEIVDISSGKRPNEKSKSVTLEYDIPCYGASKIDYYVKEALIEKPILLTGRVGTLGIIHRVYSPCFPSDNTLILLPKDYLFFEFIYFNLKQIDFQYYNRGTSQPLITQTDLKKIKIIIPNQHLLKSFNTNVKEFFKKINQNDSQIDMITKTRDILLPKLMSGEIRV